MGEGLGFGVEVLDYRVEILRLRQQLQALNPEP
jgi:hypothetical protein